MIREAIRNQGQFNVIHPSSGLKVDIIIRRNTPFDASRFSRTRRIQPGETYQANFAAPEDVIIKKMEFYKAGGSNKHLPIAIAGTELACCKCCANHQGGESVVSTHGWYRSRMISSAKVGVAVFFLLLLLVLRLASRDAAAEEPFRTQYTPASIDNILASNDPVVEPVYRIPLRVHLGQSGRSPADFKVMLEEINRIWLDQAGICFEMQIVLDDEPLERGMDIWFLPILPGGAEMNGYYRDDHYIQVRDTPILGPASHPACYPAARTAAHEFGHGLSLFHRQDSDDNLMRSKTLGWQLNSREVQEARKAAVQKAMPDTAPGRCKEPQTAPFLKVTQDR